jgi:pentatricopeptide repeat protein
VLDLAGKHGDPTLAGDVIRFIGQEGYRYRECHFVPLVDAFASTGDMRNTFQVFSAMRKVGVIPNKKTAIPIAYRLGKDKNAVRKAREALREIAADGQEVDISAFNLVIHSLAYNKEYDDAITLYAQSKEFNVKPNDETLSAVLDACIHCKDAELGVSIYQELLSKGVKASVSSLSKMVTLMCTQEDYDDAFKYLERMKKLNMVPLRGCYFKLVKTLSRANDARLGLAIDDMRACGYQLSTHMDEFILGEEEKRALASEEEDSKLSI